MIYELLIQKTEKSKNENKKKQMQQRFPENYVNKAHSTPHVASAETWARQYPESKAIHNSHVIEVN